MLQVGNTVYLSFYGDGDLLLNFFGGATGPLGNDLDIVIGDVGIRFDGKIVK